MLCFRNVLLKTLGRRRYAASSRPADALREALNGTTARDWRNVRGALLAHRGFNAGNVDAQIVGHLLASKDSDGASSYLRFMEEERLEWNLSTIGRYFQLVRLSNEGSTAIGGADEEAVLARYDELRRRYPVLDPITLESAVSALSLTRRWRQCLDLLEEIRVAGEPRATATGAVIAAAFANDDDELAWRLLRRMVEREDKTPNDDVFLSYLSASRRRGEATVVEKLDTLFKFCREYNLKLPEAAVVEAVRLCRAIGKGDAAYVTVGPKGACRHCGARLQKWELSDEEFERLKSEMFDNVIIGRDLFIKTDPGELEAFKRLIAQGKSYDVIIDGLNVAYSVGTKQPPHVLSAMLAGVVSHFAGKRILVFGRLHMRGLPKGDWDYVKRNADVFLARNLSQDDPYLLYCALSSGQGTVVVTRDHMRGHRFLLGGPRSRAAFDRWLSLRRYELARFDGDRPVFRSPPGFTSTAQKSDGAWHVPYQKSVEGPQEQAERHHKYWLCLKL